MRLENNFEVPVSVERAWEVLLDIERVAPCMPGATLTSHEGDDFTGTVKVKLGPVSLTYKGKGRFVEKDEAAHRVKLNASGADSSRRRHRAGQCLGDARADRRGRPDPGRGRHRPRHHRQGRPVRPRA